MKGKNAPCSTCSGKGWRSWSAIIGWRAGPVRAAPRSPLSFATPPAPGTVWLSRAGADALGARIGDTVGVGESDLRLAALVTAEPDAALDYFNVAPRVFVALEQLPAPGRIQPGPPARQESAAPDRVLTRRL